MEEMLRITHFFYETVPKYNRSSIRLPLLQNVPVEIQKYPSPII